MPAAIKLTFSFDCYFSLFTFARPCCVLQRHHWSCSDLLCIFPSRIFDYVQDGGVSQSSKISKVLTIILEKHTQPGTGRHKHVPQVTSVAHTGAHTYTPTHTGQMVVNKQCQ